MDYLFPLIAVLVWGGNAVVTKASAGVIAPAEIAFYRWLFAALLLTPIVGRQVLANRQAIRMQLVRLSVLGILGSALYPLLMYWAAQSTSAINIGIIQSLMPLFALVFAKIFYQYRATFSLVAGGIVSLIGAAIVVSDGHPALIFSRTPNLGDLLMLAATACFALYSVLLKQWRTSVPLLQDLYVQAIAATLALLPFFLLADRRGLDPVNAPLVAYAAMLASIIAPLVWMHSIARAGPARAALFFNLIPLVAAALAVSVLSERLNAGLILGGILTICGVVIAERRSVR